jgi:hypothetical protein
LLVADYERMGDANVRWAMDVERLGSLAPFIEAARQSHRVWLEEIFGPEMPSDAKERRRALNALHAATDVYTWKLLRRDLGVSRLETERTMARLVAGALQSPDRE